ncbi:MAG TPA: response regulator [Puia sp.]|jgi:response regulator of citrate/malate metabolism
MRNETYPTILIVDDDHDLCTILSRKLRNIAQLHSEGTLAGCLNYLKDVKPSLMLLDNSLPDGFGVSFLKKFSHLFKDIKIIVITSDTDKNLENDSLSAGAVYFLPKPFSIQTVTNTVKQALAI